MFFRISICFFCPALVVAVGAWTGLTGPVLEAATWWQQPGRLTEYRAVPGGFADHGTSRLVMKDGEGTDESTRHDAPFKEVASSSCPGDDAAHLESHRLGATAPAVIPEPDLAALVTLGVAAFIFRSRFRQSHRAASR